MARRLALRGALIAGGTEGAAPPGADASLWRNSTFIKLWASQAISLLGSQFTALALPLFAVVMLQASPAQMGLLSAMRMVPFLLLGLVAGVVVDRMPRRRILIGADLARAALLATVAAAALAGELSMPHLYAAALLLGTFTVFFDVAHQAYVPLMVSPSHPIQANSRLEASRSVAQIAGPGLAGVIVQAASAIAAVVVDSLSFLASALLIGLIPDREVLPGTPRRPLVADVRTGLELVLTHPLLRSLAGMTAMWNLCHAAIAALFILFATRNLGLPPSVIGLVLGAGNAGGLTGVLLAGPAAARWGIGRAITAGGFLCSIGLLPIAVATPATALPALLLHMTLISIGVVIYNINQLSLRQALTPPDLQGRMHATMRFLVWGTMPLGAAAGGLLAQALGTPTAVRVAAVAGAFSFLWLLLSPVPRAQQRFRAGSALPR